MTNQQNVLKRALLWDSIEDDKAKCKLCNFRCTISQDLVGRCAVRKNVSGQLYSLNYNKVCAASADPIEKKPLFHFYPGSRSFSIAAPGCNFQCEFCQNWQISQSPQDGTGIEGRDFPPEDIIAAAKQNRCSSIAYTYTEPTVFMELCDDCGRLARAEGIKNVFVSNGYMTIEAIDMAAEWLDAINVDLKAFDDNYYRSLCKASLEPVLETISHIGGNTDIWLELTTLLVPGENDSEEQLKKLTDFICEQVSPDVPWHVSRYYPNYKFDKAGPTTEAVLYKACEIASKAGLRYVYVGNLHGADGESTQCPGCGQTVIDRRGYRIISNNSRQGRCPQCDMEIAGVGL